MLEIIKEDQQKAVNGLDKIKLARAALLKLNDSSQRDKALKFVLDLENHIFEKGTLTFPQQKALQNVIKEAEARYTNQVEREKNLGFKILTDDLFPRIKAYKFQNEDYAQIAARLTSEGYRSITGRLLTRSQISDFMVARGFKLKNKSKSKQEQFSFSPKVYARAIEAKKSMDRFIESSSNIFNPSKFYSINHQAPKIEIEILESNLSTETKLRLINIYRRDENYMRQFELTQNQQAAKILKGES